MDIADADALNGSIRTIAIKHRTLTAAVFARLGLHPGQESVLFALRDAGPMTQGGIGKAIGCEPSSVTGMVQKLQAAGLIERRRSDADARSMEVALTAAGRSALPELERAWVEIADSATRRLSARDRDQVTHALQLLAAALSDGGASRPVTAG